MKPKSILIIIATLLGFTHAPGEVIFSDSFEGVQGSKLHGRTADTGQTWNSTIRWELDGNGRARFENSGDSSALLPTGPLSADKIYTLTARMSNDSAENNSNHWLSIGFTGAYEVEPSIVGGNHFTSGSISGRGTILIRGNGNIDAFNGPGSGGGVSDGITGWPAGEMWDFRITLNGETLDLIYEVKHADADSFVLLGTGTLPDQLEDISGAGLTTSPSLGNASIQQIKLVGKPGQSAYDAWAKTVFSEEDLANPKVSSLDADASGDGLSNLLAFAFGGNPLRDSSFLKPTPVYRLVEDARILGLRFYRMDNPSLLYRVEEALALEGPWNEVWSSEQNPFTGVVELVSGSASMGDEPRGFLRLVVGYDDAIRTPGPIDPILASVPLAEIRSFLWDFELPAVSKPSAVPLVEVEPGENIQSTIDVLAGGAGGTIRLKAGVHFLDEPLQLRTNTVLEGEGPETILIPRRGKRIDHIIVTEGGVHDVIIRELTIDGGRTTEERTEQAEPWPFGIFIVDGNGEKSNSRILVSDVNIRRTAMGFHSKGTDDLILQNLYLEDNGWGPGGFYHNAYLRRNNRVIVRDSVFKDSHAANGLNLTLQNDILVSGNLFIDNKARGVRAAATTNLVFDDNVAVGNKEFGIGTRRELGQGVSGYIVSNNYAVDNGINFSLLFAEEGMVFKNVESSPSVDD